MNDAELERYARHIVLREIGGPGQAELRRARVLVVGAGGLGSPLLMYLVAAGIGRVTLVDDDIVSLSNLQRQILHATSDIGRSKGQSAAEVLAALNPDCEVKVLKQRIDADNAAALIAGHDLVCDGCDNFATRFAVNEGAVRAAIPLLSAAIGQWEGQISLYAPHLGAPCYACIFPEAPAVGLVPSCAEAGVIGALPGIIGSIMALEAIKFIARAGMPLLGRMLLYDGLEAESRTVAIKRNPACEICGTAGK